MRIERNDIELLKPDYSIQETDQANQTENIEIVISDTNSEYNNVSDTTELTTKEVEMENAYNLQMDGIAQAYLGKPASECTYEELNQAYTLSLIEGMLASSKDGLKKQDDSDGIISEFFDFLKDVTNLGTSQEDVENAISEQEKVLLELKLAIRDGNFEEKYKELTGVEYNPDKIIEYQETGAKIQFASQGISKISNFCEVLKSSDIKNDPTATLNAFISFYGEEKGQAEFTNIIQTYYNETNEYEDNPISNITIDENNQMIATLADGSQKSLGGVDEIKNKALKRLYKDDYQEEKINEFLTTFENATGTSYENLVSEYKTLSNEALGDANGVTNLLNKYIDSQEGFIDKTASIAQIGGIASMVIGSAICIFSGGIASGVGLAFIKVGQIAALGGTFGDNAAELLDKTTNQKKFAEEKEEYKELVKETVVDGALFAAGYGIGQAAGSLGSYVTSSTGSKLLGQIANIGSDASLSLLTDYMITGEVNFQGEGLSQILSIITGSAMARYGSSKINTDSNTKHHSSTQDWDNPYDDFETNGFHNSDGFGINDSDYKMYQSLYAEGKRRYNKFDPRNNGENLTHSLDDYQYKSTNDEDMGFGLDDPEYKMYQSLSAEGKRRYNKFDSRNNGENLTHSLDDFNYRQKLNIIERIKTSIATWTDYKFDSDTRTRIKKQNLTVEDLPYVKKLIEAGCSSQYATDPNIIDLCKSGFEIKKYSVGNGNIGYDMLNLDKKQLEIAISSKTNYGLSDNLCIAAANYKLNDSQIKILSEAQKLGLSEELCIEAAYQNVSVEDLQYVKTCNFRYYSISASEAASPAIVLMRKLGYEDGYTLKEGTQLTTAQTKTLEEAFKIGLNEVYENSGQQEYYSQILCFEAAKAGISPELLPKLKEFVQNVYTQTMPDLAVEYFKIWVKTGYKYY